MEAATLDRAETADEQEQAAPPEQELVDGELTIDGTGQLGWEVGGKRPDSSSLRLTGGKLEVSGSFPKGSRVRLEIVCEIGEVAFVDVKDSATGQVVGSERRHKARIVAVTAA